MTPNHITQRGNAPTTHWSFTGANRGNTSDGRAWARVSRAGDTFTVTVFRDELRDVAVASGSRNGLGAVTLAEAGGSGLSGTVEIAHAATGDCELDVFYACDEDLVARHTDVSAHLMDGAFAGEPGFSGPCARAKGVVDVLLAARLGSDFRAESLAPLAEPTALYALFFLYSWLSTRADDPAGALAARFRAEAHAALPYVRLVRGAEVVTPFAPRVMRA